jgi:hypothetical protein
MFGVGASMEVSSQAFVIIKLFIVWRLSISQSMCVDPLAWWQTYKSLFSNVTFLGKQNFGILGYQIKTENF